MTRAKDEADAAARVIERTTGAAHVAIRESTGQSKAPGPSGGPERRVKPRYAIALQVTLVGGHNFYLGLSENLSEGGLFVQTQNPLAIGTTIRVEFTLPTSGDTFTVVGEVRWVRLPDAVREDHNNYGAADAEAGTPGIGIRFTEMTPETSAAITKFISIRNPEFYTE
jgi:uncharacterized protein (TIGR02266 family)